MTPGDVAAASSTIRPTRIIRSGVATDDPPNFRMRIVPGLDPTAISRSCSREVAAPIARGSSAIGGVAGQSARNSPDRGGVVTALNACRAGCYVLFTVCGSVTRNGSHRLGSLLSQEPTTYGPRTGGLLSPFHPSADRIFGGKRHGNA